MVQRLLGQTEVPKPDDVANARAIAITDALRGPIAAMKEGSAPEVTAVCFETFVYPSNPSRMFATFAKPRLFSKLTAKIDRALVWQYAQSSLSRGSSLARLARLERGRWVALATCPPSHSLLLRTSTTVT